MTLLRRLGAAAALAVAASFTPAHPAPPPPSSLEEWSTPFLRAAQEPEDSALAAGGVLYRLIWVDPFRGAPLVVTVWREGDSAHLRVVALDARLRPTNAVRRVERALTPEEGSAVEDAAIAALIWSRQSDPSESVPIPDSPMWNFVARKGGERRRYDCVTHGEAVRRLAPLIQALRMLAESEFPR